MLDQTVTAHPMSCGLDKAHHSRAALSGPLEHSRSAPTPSCPIPWHVTLSTHTCTAYGAAGLRQGVRPPAGRQQGAEGAAAAGAGAGGGGGGGGAGRAGAGRGAGGGPPRRRCVEQEGRLSCAERWGDEGRCWFKGRNAVMCGAFWSSADGVGRCCLANILAQRSRGWYIHGAVALSLGMWWLEGTCGGEHGATCAGIHGPHRYT